ncbi:MAG: radical SAM protein [Candidatus Delongbacteria bacterium]|jgi:wyosine [tRNA(Phe)-imidazoG37] synthetase (radical SAM superfamily)|nr:radical SAM protein [Candidatus Delongbacteria bacterium]
MYKHIFGPVPSRRLGVSLGIDLVPHKVCSLNCVYCECGKTTDLTIERKEYVPFDEVITELDRFMSENPKPDYITFSGSGEPTLNSRIGDIVCCIKTKYPDVSLALLTNGTLLSDPEVRKEIIDCDLVLPSFDAATEKAFLKINRPSPVIDLEQYLNGIVEFRKEFKGKIWLEVFILPNYNDSPEDLSAMKEAILKIRPDSVQLNTLDRPGAVEGLVPEPREMLKKIADDWGLDNVEIIAKVSERKDERSYNKDTESAILQTISRRPCTVEDLMNILGLHENEINKYLSTLESDGRIIPERLERGVFYKVR